MRLSTLISGGASFAAHKVLEIREGPSLSILSAIFINQIGVCGGCIGKLKIFSVNFLRDKADITRKEERVAVAKGRKLHRWRFPWQDYTGRIRVGA